MVYGILADGPAFIMFRAFEIFLEVARRMAAQV